MRQALDKIATKVLRLVPFITGFIVPLFFLPITAEFFSFNKYFFIAIISTVSLVSWCIRNLTRGKLHFTTSPALFPLVVLVLANILSSIFLSPTKEISLFGQTALFFHLTTIFFTVTSSQKNRFSIASGIYGLIISATLLSLFTLLHYFGITAKIFPSGILSNRLFNPAGGVLPALSFTTPILIATMIFITGSKNRPTKILLITSVFLMIAGTIINVRHLLPQNNQPNLLLLPIKAGWSITVDTMKTWPTALLGTGPETYPSTFTRFRPAYLNLDKYIWNTRFSESSNYIFTLFTTTGIIGALAFLFLFLRPIFIFRKNNFHSEGKNNFRFLFSALIITFLSFFVVPAGVLSLTLAFVLLICLTILCKLENHPSTKDVVLNLSANTPGSSVYHDLAATAKPTIISSFLPWLTIFFFSAVLATYWFFAGRMYLGSIAYRQASIILSQNPYNSFLKYQKAAQLDIYNPYYSQRLSQIYLSLANSYLAKENPTAEDKQTGANFAQRALDAGKISAKLDPSNVTVWENLFSIYLSLIPHAKGSADLAISHALQAASVDPTNPSIYLQIGNLFFNLGDSDQAIKFIDRASEFKPNWDIPYFNLSSLYKSKKEYVRALQYAKAGLQYTDPNGKNITAIQAEIKSLEKLVPPAATQSATIR